MKFTTLLLVIILIIVLSEITKAEIPEVEENQTIELEKIMVTNRSTSLDLDDVSENAAVISEEEIKKLPVRNLSEALNYVTGVDVSPRKGFGRETSLSIQGSYSSQVRVMIDGIPLNSLSSGQVNPSIFPVENISRIEVIKGAASSLWGSGLGGVINVITKDTGDTLVPKGSATTSLAEFRTKKDSFDLSGKAGDAGYYLMSDYMESGGEGSKDDVLEKKTFSKLSYDLKEMGKITASFGYSGADVNTGEYPDGHWEAQPYCSRYGKIGWQGKVDDVDMGIDLKHSRQKLIFKTYAYVVDEEPVSRVTSQDLLYQLSLTSTFHPREKDLLVLGGDFDWDTLKSSYLTQAKGQQLQAPYFNYRLKLEPWNLNYGLRYDHNSEYGKNLSPSLGAVYHFNNVSDSLVRFNAARAFNAPPLLWRFFAETANNAPNPELEAERAWVYELGMETKPLPEIWTKLSLYYADISDAIASATNEAGKWTKKNFKKFRRQGIEFESKVKLFEGFSFFTAAGFNDVEDRTTHKTVRGSGIARQSFNLGVEYKNKQGLGLFLRGYYNRWNEEAAVYWNQLGEEVSVDPNDRKMLFDLKITQEFKNISLFLNIYNLTNSRYWADYNFPVQKRYFEGGITLKW